MARNKRIPLLLGLLGGGGAAAFSPADIAGLALWLDASDASTLFQASDGTTPAVADGDVVGYWGDKSSAGNVVTQPTTANKPLLKLAVQNGRAVIRFDGADDVLLHSVLGTALFSADSNYVVAVMNQDSTQDNNTLLAWEENTVTNRILIYATVSNTFYWDSGSQNAGGRMSVGQPAGWDNAFHIPEFYRNGSDGEISVDGVSLATSAALTDVLNPNFTKILYLGSTAASEFLKGDIAEILIYKAAPSAAERAALLGYLNAKWAVY
jgi:hypothetical protein